MGLGHGGRERKERNEGEAEEISLGKDQAGVASPGGEAGRERTGRGPKQPTIGPFPTPEHHSGRGRGLPCLHCLRQERKEQLQEEERSQPWYQEKAWALAKVTHRVDLLGRGGHDTTHAVARQGSLVNDIYVGRGVYVGRIGTGKFARRRTQRENAVLRRQARRHRPGRQRRRGRSQGHPGDPGRRAGRRARPSGCTRRSSNGKRRYWRKGSQDRLRLPLPLPLSLLRRRPPPPRRDRPLARHRQACSPLVGAVERSRVNIRLGRGA